MAGPAADSHAVTPSDGARPLSPLETGDAWARPLLRTWLALAVGHVASPEARSAHSLHSFHRTNAETTATLSTVESILREQRIRDKILGEDAYTHIQNWHHPKNRIPTSPPTNE